MTTSIKEIVTADKIVRVITEVEDRHVDYADILDCVEIVEDAICYDPFDDDYLAHEFVAERCNDCIERIHHANNRAYVRRKPGYIEPDLDGLYQYYRENGASRQVSRELVAAARRDTIDAIRNVYDDGVYYWAVRGEFKGCQDSICGVDDFDFAKNHVRRDIADSIASQLEAIDYIVDGKPDCRAERLEAYRNALKLNLNMFNTTGR